MTTTEHTPEHAAARKRPTCLRPANAAIRTVLHLGVGLGDVRVLTAPGADGSPTVAGPSRSCGARSIIATRRAVLGA